MAFALQVFLNSRYALSLCAGAEVQNFGDFTVHTIGRFDHAAIDVHHGEILSNQITSEYRVQRHRLAGARRTGHVHGRRHIVVEVFLQERPQKLDFTFSAGQRIRVAAVQVQQRGAEK